jgi:hypothetical protein
MADNITQDFSHEYDRDSLRGRNLARLWAISVWGSGHWESICRCDTCLAYIIKHLNETTKPYQSPATTA